MINPFLPLACIGLLAWPLIMLDEISAGMALLMANLGMIMSVPLWADRP